MRAAEDRVASPTRELSESLDAILPGAPSAAATNNVLKEFECIRNKVQDPKAMIRQSQAWEMAKKFAPHLERAFNENKFSLFERALFYSQSLAETGGFYELAESKARLKSADAMDQLFTNVVNDGKFDQKQGAAKSEKMGVFRGRGLLQVTGCNNVMSVLHYINLQDRGRKPVWKSDWTYPVSPSERQPIKTVCSEQQIKALELDYRMNQKGMDADLYGALRDPNRLSMTDAEWTDPISRRKIDSERLMVRASMAYWRGRCGSVVMAAQSPEELAASEKCSKYTEGTFIERAAQCVTFCVRGTLDGWKERAAWMDMAFICARGGVHRDGSHP